ncbi:hypothetical protein QR680_006774 [Steinernema hermaphroditum]|uniref:Uncharacterized protein n=1 Tax=Steinernema hermaphroditum TaxID=289476 RepID=A0AA39LXY8_9BILA|nr:hypothetical protein QR680_006774 [Steinernema hermaphroditum]
MAEPTSRASPPFCSFEARACQSTIMKATLALLLSIALLLSLTSAFQLDQAFPFRRIRTRGQAGGYRDLPPYPACFSLYRTCNDPCYEENSSFFLPSRCCCPPPCPYRDDC